jgi:hypothetical protein
LCQAKGQRPGAPDGTRRPAPACRLTWADFNARPQCPSLPVRKQCEPARSSEQSGECLPVAHSTCRLCLPSAMTPASRLSMRPCRNEARKKSRPSAPSCASISPASGLASNSTCLSTLIYSSAPLLFSSGYSKIS